MSLKALPKPFCVEPGNFGAQAEWIFLPQRSAEEPNNAKVRRIQIIQMANGERHVVLVEDFDAAYIALRADVSPVVQTALLKLMKS